LKFVVDTHTHTVASGHAYSTVQEMAREAYVNDIEMFAITDHGPALKGAPYYYHFTNMRAIPDVLYGVRILKGVEANIIDYNGNLDMPKVCLKRLDFVIASFHDICIEPASIEEHTNAYLNLMKNPFVDAIGHPGTPEFEVDIEKVVSAAKKYGKFIEINNNSFTVRYGCEENCLNFALECKKQGVKIVCGSDAHISFDVGKFDEVYTLLERIDMPEELIMNTKASNFIEYINNKRKRIRMSDLIL